VSPLTRREFLLRASALGGGISASSMFGALSAVPEPAAPLDIVIVGAGLAGLCAAYELEKRGHRLTLLEADQRHVGGRTRTLRFGDGLYGEAGTMRIPARHEITRHYVREFELPLRKFALSNPQAYYFLRGERQRIADVAKLNRLYALRDDERNKTPDDLWADSIGKTVAGLSEQERKVAGLRRDRRRHGSSGIDFRTKLRSKPKLGCEVIRLTQRPDRQRVAAIYRERGVEKRAEGDFILCTLPFPVLTRIVVEPEFSGPKWRAIRELNYGSSTKVLVVCNRRFWEVDDGLRAAQQMLVAAQRG
jgi:monoamine oxidase